MSQWKVVSGKGTAQNRTIYIYMYIYYIFFYFSQKQFSKQSLLKQNSPWPLIEEDGGGAGHLTYYMKQRFYVSPNTKFHCLSFLHTECDCKTTVIGWILLFVCYITYIIILYNLNSISVFQSEWRAGPY